MIINSDNHHHQLPSSQHEIMVLELHVWGPAFDLPSIDPQCLATIAYFSLVVPKDAWVLVPSSDPSVSPTSMSPSVSGLIALREDSLLTADSFDR